MDNNILYIFLRNDAKIETKTIIDLDNHKKYLQHWKGWLLENEEETAKKIDSAFIQAQKESNYIIGKEKQREKKLIEELQKEKSEIKEKISSSNRRTKSSGR